MIENRYAKIIDEKTKEVQVGVGCPDEYYIEIGMTLMEVEYAYNGNWYLAGYAPVKPEPTEPTIEDQCNIYLNTYVQPYATDIFKYNDLSAEEQKNLSDYRKYLIEYKEGQHTEYPLDYDSWKAQI